MLFLSLTSCLLSSCSYSMCINVQDYSWEDHGFSLMNRLYGEMAQLLEEKFQVVCALTYHTMAMHTEVDTSTLRKAVWNYIHCIYGIRSVTY